MDFQLAPRMLISRMEATVNAFTRYLLTALITASLVWGGFLPCSQDAGSSAAPVKDCCNHNGQCKQTPGTQTSQQCNLQSAILPGAAHHTFQPVAQTALTFKTAFMPLQARCQNFLACLQDRGSPPDLNLLHSILRV